MLYVPFSDFFQLRRDNFATVTYEDKGSFYISQAVLQDGRTILCSIAKNTSDGNYFELNYMPKCNKSHFPDVLDLITHDFCTNTWVNADSSFAFLPSPGKVIELQEVKTVCYRDLNFGTNKIIMAVWESISAQCPAYNYLNKTPYNQENSGWTSVWPPPYYIGQEVSIFVKWEEILGQQVPLYKVTEFKYDHPRRLRQKARNVSNYQVSEDPPIFETEAWYPYKERKVRLHLRASMNERAEIFLEQPTPFSGNNGIPSTASAVFHSYEEW